MKPTSTLSLFAIVAITVLTTAAQAVAQEYKLRQSTSMTGMKSESTIYVKGMRKRTEGAGFAGHNLVTIEQCDLQRTIKINDKKKLYYIEPFSEDITDENVKPAPAKNKPVAAAAKKEESPQKGGVITMWYNITDTGERKKMYGLIARHVWTTQKIKPSADACMMKDSMIIKTDGWYIDLPQFNCPVSGMGTAMNASSQYQPGCRDRFVSRRSGKGKLGFPLMETRTMIMANGSMQTSEFTTSLETLEFSTTRLDSMLFEIPIGYQQAKSEEELHDKADIAEMMRQYSNNSSNNKEKINPDEPKKPGAIRIAVFAPLADEQLQPSVLQEYLVGILGNDGVEAIAVGSEADARKYSCDLLLNTEFTRVKQASKVGSILKAIKNTDPSAVSSYTIEANLVLVNLFGGTTRSQQKVSGKFDGKPDEAAKKALEQGCAGLLNDIK